MSLIEALASNLNIDNDKAEGVAGTVLGAIKEQVGEKLGGDAAGELTSAVPELSGWAEKASALTGGDSGGGLGGIMGAASGLLGGGGGFDIAKLAGTLGKLDISASSLPKLIPLVAPFLKERVSPELFSKIASFVPGMDGDGDSGGGGIAGALGGLLGG